MIDYYFREALKSDKFQKITSTNYEIKFSLSNFTSNLIHGIEKN